MIHDGEEGIPAPFAYVCPACGATRTGELWTILARARTSGLEGLGLPSRQVLGTTLHATPSGLTAYRADVDCSCGAPLMLVLGFWEFQPCRYQAELHAVVRRSG